MNPSISILGCGNIGSSVAKGLVRSKHFKAKDIFLTRRNLNLLKKLKNDGFNITSDNKTATNNTQTPLSLAHKLRVTHFCQHILGAPPD